MFMPNHFHKIALSGTAAALSAAGALAGQPCGSWVQVAPPTFQGEDLVMIDVVSFGPDNASGFGLTFGPNGIDPTSIILTHWNGVSWQVVNQVDLDGVLPGIPRGVVAMDGSSENNLWFVGTFDPPGFVFARPFLAHWDGSSWSFEYPDSDGGYMTDIGYVSDSEIYLFGDTVTPWVWDGSGLSFFTPPAPVSIGSETVADAAVLGSDSFWIAGYQAADVSTPNGLSLWNWNGNQWSEILPGDVNFLTGDELAEDHVFSLAAISADDIWSVGDKQLLTSGDVFGTYLHWDGSSWTEFPGPQEIRPMTVAAVASDDVWAFGAIPPSNELLFAHWDGAAWSLIPQGTLQGVELVGSGIHEMVTYPDCTGWALGRVSADGGATASPLVLRLTPGGSQGCNEADIAEPFDVLDLNDIQAFVDGFLAQDPIADLNGDGVLDLNDVNLFITAFANGCPS